MLVTGGAGYIGSHVVRQLGEAGEKIVVIDNLGRGFRQAVTAGELVVGDVGDFELVSRLLMDHHVDTVMHFAAHKPSPEHHRVPIGRGQALADNFATGNSGEFSCRYGAAALAEGAERQYLG